VTTTAASAAANARLEADSRLHRASPRELRRVTRPKIRRPASRGSTTPRIWTTWEETSTTRDASQGGLSFMTQSALVKGQVAGEEDVLVRVHSECLTGDVFHSLKCDCGEQLELALARIEEEGKGVLLYLAQEGRGIGLLNKLKAYELQEQGLDTVEANLRLGFAADQREYGIGSQILADLGLSTIRVLTNNPKKISGIAGFGLEVVAQEPIVTEPNDENRRYLATKREKLGHKLHHQDLRFDPDLYDGAEA